MSRLDEATTSPPRLSQQCRMLLEYLQAGKAVTNLIAITNLGIGSLSSRIAELRAAGYKVSGEEREDWHGKRYVSYTLPKEGDTTG